MLPHLLHNGGFRQGHKSFASDTLFRPLTCHIIVVVLMLININIDCMYYSYAAYL